MIMEDNLGFNIFVVLQSPITSDYQFWRQEDIIR